MKKGFIRALWGEYIEDGHRAIRRREKIDLDIEKREIQREKIDKDDQIDFLTYVMGEDNLKRLESQGHECRLVSKGSSMYDLVEHQYRHKLECIRVAMEEDGYDELIFLDWDCVQIKKLPEYFWENQKEKGTFQANLQSYKCRIAGGRKIDKRKVPNGGYMYIGDKTLPSKAIEQWEEKKISNDEPAWAKVTDNMHGGWQGVDFYWDNFEAMYCNLARNSAYLPDRLVEKSDVCFIHNQGKNFT